MKKSTIVVLIGGFVLLTAFLGPLSSEKMYKKVDNFKTPEELIEMIDGKPLLQLKKTERYGHETEETKEFAECLSVRKRVTDSDCGISKFDIKEVVDLDEKTENDILNYYDSLRGKFSKRLPISDQKVMRLKIDSYHIRNHRTGEMERSNAEGVYDFLDLVFINEGEGYVIDFIERFDAEYIPDYSRLNKYGDLYDPERDEKSYSIDEYNSMSQDGIIEEEVEDNA